MSLLEPNRTYVHTTWYKLGKNFSRKSTLWTTRDDAAGDHDDNDDHRHHHQHQHRRRGRHYDRDSDDIATTEEYGALRDKNLKRSRQASLNSYGFCQKQAKKLLKVSCEPLGYLEFHQNTPGVIFWGISEQITLNSGLSPGWVGIHPRQALNILQLQCVQPVPAH